MTTVPELTMNNGRTIPQLGFGVFQIDPGETAEAVSRALKIGYRHIDTAEMYRNEKGVGEAVRSSGIPREQIFVTTKLWNEDQGYDSALRAFEASLGRLGLDYVDLYLIHWPAPRRDRYVASWRALEKLYADARARAIGVSNFQVDHLKRLLAETDAVPAVNQIELHPRLQQEELRAFHAEQAIVTEAWSPLAQGELLEEPTIRAIAAAHGKSAAHVILRWHLQLGACPLPKSATPQRQRENIDVFGFELDEPEMTAITALGRPDGRLFGGDPDTHEEL